MEKKGKGQKAREKEAGMRNGKRKMERERGGESKRRGGWGENMKKGKEED